MPIVNQTAFARMIGVSQPSVSAACKTGSVRTNGRNKIDTDDPINIFYAQNCKKRDMEQPVASTKVDADIAKLQAQTAKLHIELAQQMGKPVPRTDVDAVFGRISSAISNHLFPLGQRIAPTICGKMGSTKPEDILEIAKIIDAETKRIIETVKIAARFGLE